MPRNFGLKGTLMLFAATAVYGVAVGGHTSTVLSAASAWSGLGIENIEISGQIEASEVDILKSLDVGPYPSLLTFDVEAARDRVENLPWVEVATLTKLFPGTLKVEIGERQPFAVWQHDGAVVLIDETGVEIGEAPAGRFEDLPFVVGEGAAARIGEFLALLEVAPDLRERIYAGVLVSGARWTVVMDNGIELMLPAELPEVALAEIAELDRERLLLSREIAAVDFRFGDRVVVRLTEVAIEARAKLLKERARTRRTGA